MKRVIIIILTVITLGQLFAQTDNNGNPVFNSIQITEKRIDDFLLISNYYTLGNNIENRLSSVFISENPTLEQIEKAMIDLTSDFFILTKESRMVAMIILQNSPRREFMTIEMSNNRRRTFPSRLMGDITENRANEIISGNFDPTAKIEGNILTFNGNRFTIIGNKEIEEAVLELIKKERLYNRKPSNITLLSRNEMQNFILYETKEGGRLDFFTEIKGREFDGVQIRPGVFTTRQSIAFYQWGRACFNIGVNTIEDAYEIFELFKGRTLNTREKEYIRMGFYKEWER